MGKNAVVATAIVGVAAVIGLLVWEANNPHGPGSGDEIEINEPTGPGSGDEIDTSEPTGPESGDEIDTSEPTGPGSGDEIDTSEPAGPGSGDEIDTSEPTGPGSGDEIDTSDRNGPGSGDEINIRWELTKNTKGSCNSIAFAGSCIDYIGSYFSDWNSIKFHCSDSRSTPSKSVCPNSVLGGCRIGVGTSNEYIIWAYDTGVETYLPENIGYFPPACIAIPGNQWVY